MRIRRLIAALTLASATLTGLTLATTPATAADIDTSVSTPVTTADTHWGIAPVDGQVDVTTQDTHWG